MPMTEAKKAYEKKRAKRRWAEESWIPRDRRSSNTKYAYKLKPGELELLYSEQGGKCAICGEPGASRGKGCLCVDHDHTTGKIRGLLCASCNSGVGFFKESPERLHSAIEYIKLHT